MTSQMVDTCEMSSWAGARKSMGVVVEVEIFERVPACVELWTLQKS